MSFNQDIQQLEPGSLVQLIEVDGTAFGMDTVLRFHAYNLSPEGWKSFAGENLPSIIWQGNEYDPHPYELSGVEMSSTGAQPTPKLSVSNVGNFVTALCLQFDDLVKARVKIHTTMVKYLDAANWIQGNPGANPQEERVQLFYVNAKTAETRSVVEFELCSPFDIQSLQLPSRQITPVCSWCMRGLYRTGTGCDYTGTRYFAKDGTPTSDPSKDVCGGRLADCKARFGADQPLPFGGFPAANLQGK
ncbi:phage minor tail protein L [Pantoea sp. Mb-10]|uniref:phage minor tail protein L n=1 Tax=unclassified Pantoea TaxID=2630326 RepID=UPI001E648EB3|nr:MULTISPECIES: phage minor tail protein L [unclassified Pantoea]MCE0490999.1 phage minor tail protein L [Pantoea sp. Mb-10]MCE0499843.1 phage minor tail protein L [Pantoea sp. Pb-8]